MLSSLYVQIKYFMVSQLRPKDASIRRENLQYNASEILLVPESTN